VNSQPRSNTGFWIVIVLLAIGLLVSFALNFGLAAALLARTGHGLSADEQAVDEFPSLTEVWSYGEGDVKAVRIAVTGIIMRESEEGLFAMPEDKIELILAQIRAAQHDNDVHAIIVEVDSPGGGITASDEIYRALLDFKDSQEGRTVIVFMRDLAASGGYYVAMAGDWLIAQPTTVLGSIGVIMQSVNIKGLSEKIGITDVTIKSGANKDLLNPFNDVDPAQRALLQEMIDSMYEHFLGIVQSSRPIEASELRKLADGRIFVAPKALDLKLVDQIGYWDDVLAKTAELLGVDSVKVVRFEHHVDFMTWFLGVRQSLNPRTWFDAHRPRLLYLWQP
jgi:protease-4